MDTSFKAVRQKAAVVYSIIILMGIVLSGVVYISTQKVKHSVSILVEQEIPIYRLLQQLDAAITEQERLLYEYYATQNRNLYRTSFIQTSTHTNQLLQQLETFAIAPQQLQAIASLQLNVTQLAEVFDQYMYRAFDGEDWEQARADLQQFTNYRQDIVPVINQIAEQTRLRVEQQYLNTQSNLQQTSYTVLIYSALILALAMFIGRYVRSYIVISAQSRRLALFPTRNPNPILSFDEHNQVSFANPATTRLIEELSIDSESFYSQMAANIVRYQKNVIKSEHNHCKFEINAGSKTLESELHHLKDLNTWDLHLVDVTLRKQAEDKVNYQAYHELHTGLFNKNKLYEVLENNTRRNKDFVVGIIEIKQYSQLVTSRGLEATGNIVRELAETFNDLFADILLDQGYMLFQTSDKNFALIIENQLSSMEINKLGKLIESEIENHEFANSQIIELDFGFCCVPEHANSKSGIMKCVNIALERAINCEHASVVVYSEELGHSIEKEFELIERLKEAIDNQAFELYFQPQLDIQNGRIIGVETLIRWPTKDGFISPGEFIPLAEKSGLIIPLGNWILENACLKARALVDAGYENIVVAVNISPQQFRHPDFCDVVAQILQETQVPAANVELEITEGVIMYNEADTITSLNKLKETGVMMSIDDFGTGYSSLSYLKQFPIDKLKIDQSFVRQLQDDQADQAIVRTVIDLGSHLQLKLIAEGVEHNEQLQLLKDMGCHEIQGYFFCRPLCSIDLDNFLEKHRHLERIAV